MSKIVSNFALLVSKKEVRENRLKRYSQKEIAEALAVSESTVSRWMNGKDFEKISLEMASKLADWLGCEISDLFEVERES